VLGLDANAPDAKVSAAYHRLAQMYHPDKVAGLTPEYQVIADQRMKEINLAYESLKQRPVEMPPCFVFRGAGAPWCILTGAGKGG
jgi:preprotein translocase subunit Sec63